MHTIAWPWRATDRMSMHNSSSKVPVPLVATRSWIVDSPASSVRFRIRHFGVATVEGRFTRFAGSIDRHGAGARLDVASIDTGNDIRDRRLCSPEFFDVDRHPTIGFEADGPLAAITAGGLTIKEVTRPVVLELAMEGLDGGAVGLRSRASISRKEFGLEWDALWESGRLIVSDRVDLRFDLVLRPA